MSKITLEQFIGQYDSFQYYNLFIKREGTSWEQIDSGYKNSIDLQYLKCIVLDVEHGEDEEFDILLDMEEK